MKYLNCGEIDRDMIDYHSWPELFFFFFQALFVQLLSLCV